MARERISISLALFAFQLSQASAQDQVDICYGPEGVVVAVIVTFLVTLALLAAGLFMYKTYWKSRQGESISILKRKTQP